MAKRSRPVLLTLAVALVLLQCLGLAVLAIGGLGALFGGGLQEGSAPGVGQDGAAIEMVTIVTLAVVLLGLAVLLVAAARGLWQGKRWGRAPIITWQILLILVAANGWAGWWWATAALVVLAVAVIVAVLSPSVRNATGDASKPDAIH